MMQEDREKYGTGLIILHKEREKRDKQGVSKKQQKYIWLKLGRKKESKFKDKEKNGRYSYKKESVQNKKQVHYPKKQEIVSTDLAKHKILKWEKRRKNKKS